MSHWNEEHHQRDSLSHFLNDFNIVMERICTVHTIIRNFTFWIILPLFLYVLKIYKGYKICIRVIMPYQIIMRTINAKTTEGFQHPNRYVFKFVFAKKRVQTEEKRWKIPHYHVRYFESSRNNLEYVLSGQHPSKSRPAVLNVISLSAIEQH